MKQECGETLGDLEPVYDLFSITSELGSPEAVTLCKTRPAEKVVILTVNHRSPLTARKHDFEETRMEWGRGWGWVLLSLFKTRFRSPKAGTQTCGLLVNCHVAKKQTKQACARMIIKHHARSYNISHRLR